MDARLIAMNNEANRIASERLLEQLRDEGLRYRLVEGGRVIVRPSGTEPKVKCYLEVVVPVHPEDGVAAARIAAAGRLDALGRDIRSAAGI